MLSNVRSKTYEELKREAGTEVGGRKHCVMFSLNNRTLSYILYSKKTTRSSLAYSLSIALGL